MLDWWHFSVLKSSLALPDFFAEPLLCVPFVEEASENTVMEAFLWWHRWILHRAILASPGAPWNLLLALFHSSWHLPDFWNDKWILIDTGTLEYYETLVVISILFKQVSLTSFWKERVILSHAAKEAWRPRFPTSLFKTQREVSLVPEGWDFRLLSQVLPGWVG